MGMRYDKPISEMLENVQCEDFTQAYFCHVLFLHTTLHLHAEMGVMFVLDVCSSHTRMLFSLLLSWQRLFFACLCDKHLQ